MTGFAISRRNEEELDDEEIEEFSISTAIRKEGEMPRNARAAKGYATATLILLIVVLSMIVPRTTRSNPVFQGILITEFTVQPSARERIELYLVNMYGYDLRDFVVETDFREWPLHPHLVFPDTGFVIVSDSSVYGDLELRDEGGYIRIREGYEVWAEVRYGDDYGSVVPAPMATMSASAEVRTGEYYWHWIPYYYLDGSPTIGEWNDHEDARGVLHGTVTDSSTGLPVESAVVVASDSSVTSTNSSGTYGFYIMSGFPTITVTADGYRSYASDIGEIILLPDSTVTHDVELAVGSGIRTSDTNGQSAPRSFSLSQNYPNPFNPSTTIRYEIQEGNPPGERMCLDIFDTRGRRVRTLVDTERSPGRYTVRWDGKDEYGLNVGSGVYLYQLRVGSDESTRRMVVLK